MFSRFVNSCRVMRLELMLIVTNDYLFIEILCEIDDIFVCLLFRNLFFPTKIILYSHNCNFTKLFIITKWLEIQDHQKH